MENKNINPLEYNVGIIIGRFQIDELHQGHKSLIEEALKNHKEVIIFIGISEFQDTNKNPLSFNIRKMMIEQIYSQVTFIVPIYDQPSNEKWSENLDRAIDLLTNNKKTLLYCSRDSFSKSYSGNYPIFDFPEHGQYISSTKARHEIANIEYNSTDFRRGIISARMNDRNTVIPCVDIACYNEKGQVLLARKAKEDKFRFVGGKVDPTDKSYNDAARREWSEETNKIEISALTSIYSLKVEDRRTRGTNLAIISELFVGQYIFGSLEAGDDLKGGELKWFDIDSIDIENDIMPEHNELMKEFIKYYNTELVETFK